MCGVEEPYGISFFSTVNQSHVLCTPNDQPGACFVDTNIWLYARLETGETTKCATARKLIQNSTPVVSVQVINEVCVNLPPGGLKCEVPPNYQAPTGVIHY